MRSTLIITALAILGAVSLVGTPAGAVDVFVNGVAVQGALVNMSLEGVTDVKFDAAGNVHITAPGYKLQVAGTPTQPTTPGTTGYTTPPGNTGYTTPPGSTGYTTPPGNTGYTTPPGNTGYTTPPGNTGYTTQPTATPPSNLSNVYYLVAQCTNPGAVQYQFNVSLNGQQLEAFTDSQCPYAIDVSQYLTKGTNMVAIKAFKAIQGARKSTAAADNITVIIGKAHIANNNLVVDQVMVNYSRNASEMGAFSNDYTFDAQ